MFLVARTDDPELLEWLSKAREEGGGFVSHLAHAGLVADHENYPMIRGLLMFMRKKYPAYEPSDAVKAEIKAGPEANQKRSWAYQPGREDAETGS